MQVQMQAELQVLVVRGNSGASCCGARIAAAIVVSSPAVKRKPAADNDERWRRCLPAAHEAD
jgi:hypothetical protein